VSTGLTVLGGLAALVAGGWAALAGVSALLGDALLAAPPGPLLGLDIAGWGWLLVALGTLLAGSGIAILQGGVWARLAGLVLATLGLVVGFVLGARYPGWAVLIIGLDLVAVGALTGPWREAGRTGAR
jgi:hypothetical protein